MEVKTCNKCNVTQPIDDFPLNKGRHETRCKKCRNEYLKKYRSNPENAKLSKEYKHQWHKNNKTRLNKKSKEYVLKHKERVTQYKREYNSIRRIKRKERADSDPFYRFTHNIRCSVRRAVVGKGWSKRGNSEEILGCTFDFLRKHIERQFSKGMTWENYGQWHVDHRIPLSSAKTEKEALELCHYNNLQPMWAKDNIVKQNKIINGQTYLLI